MLSFRNAAARRDLLLPGHTLSHRISLPLIIASATDYSSPVPDYYQAIPTAPSLLAVAVARAIPTHSHSSLVPVYTPCRVRVEPLVRAFLLLGLGWVPLLSV
jgi:hypothetical protein